MPAFNPIIGGKHIASYSSSAGMSRDVPAGVAAAAGGGFMSPAGQDYRWPSAIVIFIALALLVAGHLLGFSLGVAARVTAA